MIALSIAIGLQSLFSTEGFQATIQNNKLHTTLSHNYNLFRSENPSLLSHQRFSTRQWASLNKENIVPNSNIESEPEQNKSTPFYKLPKAACRIYAAYVKRLWKETDVAAREKVADDKVRGSIRGMQHILVHAKEYAEFDEATNESQQKLMAACEEMLEALPKREPPKKVNKKKKQEDLEMTTEVVMTSGEVVAPKKKKGQRSILFGALMGLSVALWVFSGSYLFTGIFCSMTILGQLEYYRMVMNTGVYPARRISVIGAASMFLTVS